ncbi:uncharacterized protein LOC119598663 isoform X1 [Penaeus monodon]|uniref:uncharacterized protein LOC119598663 isoform X1 n=1 Tax=Penaeus monodon TaxID=6687 RepID=UPI0018A755D4|nr:uncharacterized protein LOC119598663 isoform X1 [Penaeus monodon]XP_037804300.1 uncharacterized protein LOC119598663 isoform X1 [Penaeus monodon]XP_037804301.1 uncharacterized protein LOC119598663 isoform X1 [Penaeus monodon]XP_037804304.1 uncharacterized protein LOC119598663 isoform X1 [Penaeus monodon]XP_037804305.1 uncharacterized protein LOC119598663 isoform X1 [Penaeus monodon]
MAPRKRHHIESLEELSLRVVLYSVVADLHLAHLMTTELRHSITLSSLPVSSPEHLKEMVAERLKILPGVLNDQVRDRMVRRLFSSPEPDRWLNAKLDILKVVLDDSVTSIDCGEQALPRRLLSVVGEQCPNIRSLKVTLHQIEADDSPVEASTSVATTRRHPYFLRETNFMPAQQSPTSSPTKVTLPLSLMSGMSTLSQLTTLHLTYGASNAILAALGQCAPKLQELHMCYSYSVTDSGIKALLLRNPERHVLRKGRNLHELRVRSMHLNPCCSGLREVDIMGTGVSQFGVAFLLKHVPNLRSLGDCNSVPEALEILVGNKSLQRSSFMARLRKYARRFKLTRVKEDCVSASKVLVVATLCPDIKDLSLWHRFREVDLDRLNDLHSTPSHFTSHLMQLKNLKHLTMVNVSSRSVAGTIQALGSQLTALTVQCRGLDVPGIFENCTNLKYLTMEGEDCSAPYEAVDSFRHTALTKLQVVKIKCHLPTPYTDMILNNAKSMSRLEINCLCDISDDQVNQLINNKCLEKLKEFDVSRAPKLTMMAARMLVQHCPKLRHLQDLGGWNITAEEFNAFLKETEMEDYDIHIIYNPRRKRSFLCSSYRSESYTDEEFMEDSYEDSEVWGPMRYQFPLVIL